MDYLKPHRVHECSDHLNSVPFLEDSHTLISLNARLSYMNGRSYYRWMICLYQRRSMALLHYTKGHFHSTVFRDNLHRRTIYQVLQRFCDMFSDSQSEHWSDECCRYWPRLSFRRCFVPIIIILSRLSAYYLGIVPRECNYLTSRTR
ncbi:hypothetical protein BDZ94DRAFT_806200 [Collybia nuda]|uniref:Uncharacterized protein n=1 Tax=Collybia nuda TaxID=64659 RepID=A0A9P5XRN7_9AGAR|nr:hypothetical protein BDZ94DRAFT_806200 [Collybia nuda]